MLFLRIAKNSLSSLEKNQISIIFRICYFFTAENLKMDFINNQKFL